MQNIYFIFLGAILTYLGTFSVEVYKNNQDRKNKEKNFKLVAQQEFQSISKTLEKLKTVFEYKSYFEYTIITTLDKSILSLESIKHDSIYLKDTILQEKFINVISELSGFTSSARGFQDFFYNQQRTLVTDKLNAKKIRKGTLQKESVFNTEKENLEAFLQKSTQEFIDLVEINRKLDEIMSLLDR